jgi:hypothetical protein
VFAAFYSVKFATLKLWMTWLSILALGLSVWLAFGLAGVRDRYRDRGRAHPGGAGAPARRRTAVGLRHRGHRAAGLPISWNHHWVWAVPALVWAFARLPRSLPRRWRPLGLLAALATFAVFVALPKHPTTNYPLAPPHSSPGITDPLAHITGWIRLMPMYGNDGYYWSGTQIIVGNLYVIFGLAFPLVAWGYLAVIRRQTAPAASVPEAADARALEPANPTA